jgi:hypothetical protein
MSEINLLPWRAANRIRRVRLAKIVCISLLAILLCSLLIYKMRDSKIAVPVAPLKSVNQHKQLDNEIARIHYVGYVHQGARTWALLLFANGETQDVEVGTQLVWLNAKITAITEQHVTLIANDKLHTLSMLR